MACSIMFRALKKFLQETIRSSMFGTYIVVGTREGGGWEELVYVVLSNFILLLCPTTKVEGSNGWGYDSQPMLRILEVHKV